MGKVVTMTELRRARAIREHEQSKRRPSGGLKPLTPKRVVDEREKRIESLVQSSIDDIMSVQTLSMDFNDPENMKKMEHILRNHAANVSIIIPENKNDPRPPSRK
jgi:hypothetical protein